MSSEVAAAMVSGLFLLVIGLLPYLHVQGKRLKKVQYQVVNGHDSNLRDDIDKIHNTMTFGFGQVNHRMDLLQTDLAWERRERMDQIARLEKTHG